MKIISEGCTKQIHQNSSFLTNINDLEIDIEVEKRKIKKRLVSTEYSFDPVNIRKSLKRKIKPLPISLSEYILC